MDWLTYTTEIVERIITPDGLRAVLSWPVAAVVLVLLLRGSIASLLAGLQNRLSKVSLGDTTFEFVDEAVANMQEQVPKEEADGLKPTLVTGSPWLTTNLKVAELDPKAAALSAWVRLETTIRDLAEYHLAYDSEERQRKPVMHLVFALQGMQVLRDWHARVVYEFSQIRNRLAHEPGADIGAEQAKSLSAVVQEWIQSIESTNNAHA